MEELDFTRARVLNNIPAKKLQDKLDTIREGADTQDIKVVKLTAINRYAESNIPIMYWDLDMKKNFIGDQEFIKLYNEYTADIRSSYISGRSAILSASHGRGKTFTITSILKKCCHKGNSCLYSTLSDIINAITKSNDEFLAKRELTMVDFLAIDEVDNRFFDQSNATNEFFARSLEIVLRSRLQNKLPILMATNSPNIKESFKSMFKDSLGSLLFDMPIISVVGEDYRKIK